MPERKVYIGDSVYATFDGYGIWLTTENGYPDDPRNKIYLEPNVYDALLTIVARWNRETLEQMHREDQLAEARETADEVADPEAETNHYSPDPRD